MPNIPKQKPYTEEKFKQDADRYIKGYLGGFDKGEMNQFLKKSVDKIENAGVMSSDEAKDFIKERASYLREFAKENKGETLPQMKASGGRIGFLEGGDTKYNAMVTEMYIKLGGKEGTGMDIDSFAEKYFSKFAKGGRAQYQYGGGADASQDDFGGSNNNFGGGDGNNREQYGAKGQYSRPPSAPSGKDDNRMNIINTLSRFRPDAYVNPNNYSIGLNKYMGPFQLNLDVNTLGMLGIDDPRTAVDESELDDYGIRAGFNKDVLGGNLNLSGSYNPTTGTNFGLNFSKQFNQGGRVNYNQGSLDPDTLALKEKIEEIMDIEGVGFGEAFKQAMRELASQSKE